MTNGCLPEPTQGPARILRAPCTGVPPADRGPGPHFLPDAGLGAKWGLLKQGSALRRKGGQGQGNASGSALGCSKQPSGLCDTLSCSSSCL